MAVAVFVAVAEAEVAEDCDQDQRAGNAEGAEDFEVEGKEGGGGEDAEQ